MVVIEREIFFLNIILLATRADTMLSPRALHPRKFCIEKTRPGDFL